jgi:hypothetical protein
MLPREAHHDASAPFVNERPKPGERGGDTFRVFVHTTADLVVDPKISCVI